MTIAGWACPHCNNKQAPLDHYATTECGLKIHPAYAAAVLYDEATDPHGKEMSVTDGLGCPRARAIDNQADVYVDPTAYNARLLGKAWDAVVGNVVFKASDERLGNEGASGKNFFYPKLKLRGVIADMEIVGELDNVRRLGARLILSDWKHSNNFRQKWIKQEGTPSMEYRIQTSIYAELYRQMYDEMPTDGEVVYHFSGGGKDVLMPYQYSIIPVDQCLEFKPYGGQYTVEELYRMAQGAYPNGTEQRAIAWQQFPLVGETMSFGTKSYCDYCELKGLCYSAARGAPF